MKFSSAVDAYMADQRSQGRISSDASETVYRLRLNRLSDDISNRDPRYVNREDIKATLARWPNPNTQSHSRSIFVAFFDWLVEEGFRKDNPARATRPPKKREPQLYRLTRDETLAMMAAASTTREKRAIFLGFCAGLRNRELRGMQGKHFQRDGWVWVTKDIAKGGRERQVPVLAELEPVVKDIRENVGLEEFVLPAQRFNPKSKRKVDVPSEGCSSDSLVRIVKRVSRNAGIPVEIKPHAMRHAFASYVIRFAGLRETQFFLGHKSLKTTEDYLNKPLLEELSAAVVGFSFDQTDANVRSTLSLASPQSHQEPDLTVNTASPDVPAQSDFPAAVRALRGLWASQAIRKAAKEMVG